MLSRGPGQPEKTAKYFQMKYISTFLLSICLLATTVSFAQKIDVNLGIKVGGNFSQINGKYWENGYKANPLGGAFVSVQGPRFGVQLEALFTQSSFVAGNDFNDLYSELYQQGKDSIEGGSFRVSYLSIPLLLNIKLLPKVKIQVGPQYSGVVNVQDKDQLLKDAKGLFKSGSLDGVIGLWVDLPARFNVGARYVVGLSNINTNDGINVGSQEISDAWRQRSLQVHVGYSIF